MKKDFHFELLPVHSPLLGQSLLVSFPPLTDMLKFSGLSCATQVLMENVNFFWWLEFDPSRDHQRASDYFEEVMEKVEEEISPTSNSI